MFPDFPPPRWQAPPPPHSCNSSPMSQLHQCDTFVTGSDTVREAEEMQNPWVQRFLQGAHMGSGALFEPRNPLLLDPSRMFTPTGEVRVKSCSSFHKSSFFLSVALVLFLLVWILFIEFHPTWAIKKVWSQNKNKVGGKNLRNMIIFLLLSYYYIFFFFCYAFPHLSHILGICVLQFFYITMSFCNWALIALLP